MLNRIQLAARALVVSCMPFAAAAQDYDPVTINYLSFHGSVQAHELAEELGYFENTGITIKPQGYSTGGPESMMAMATGDIQVSVVATSAMLNAIANGYDVVATYPSQGMLGDVVSKFYVLEDSGINEIGDLAGKVIAVNTLGAHLDFVVREALHQAGVDQGSVKLITVPNPQLEQVLRGGQADVVAIGYWVNTFQGAIEQEGGVKVLFRDLDIVGELSGGFALMTREFVDRNPEAVREFTLQSARALDFSRENIKETREAIARILERRGENVEVAQYFLGYGVRPGGLGTREDVQFWVDLMERENLISANSIDIDSIMFMTAEDVSSGEPK